MVFGILPTEFRAKASSEGSSGKRALPSEPIRGAPDAKSWTLCLNGQPLADVPWSHLLRAASRILRRAESAGPPTISMV